jgi:hypothetical protein
MIFPGAYPSMHFLPILILPDGPFNSKVLHSRELLCYTVVCIWRKPPAEFGGEQLASR